MSIQTVRPIQDNSAKTSETAKETKMEKWTVTLTTEQTAKLDFLRKTTITGNTKEDGIKSIEEITWQAIERGIASIEQTRKQYTRTRLALKAYKG